MIPETLVSSILTASVTGAGLVIAFYALIAHMSDKIFERRFELLDEKNKEVEQIVSSGEGFKDENLKTTIDRLEERKRALEELSQEIDSIKTFPRYLGPIVAINFGVFLLTALFSLIWLFSSPENRANINDWVIPLLFSVSVGLFAIVGISGIGDAMGTMKDQFEKARKKKEKVKEKIRRGPAEAQAHVELVEEALVKIGVAFQQSPLIKINGTALVPDFVVPSAKNPRYLIEVVIWPNADLIYRLSVAYQKLKSQTLAKTILISDFGDRLTLLDIARAYWDFVVDLQSLDKLKGIVEK
jgi:hypothetical protein